MKTLLLSLVAILLAIEPVHGRIDISQSKGMINFRLGPEREPVKPPIYYPRYPRGVPRWSASYINSWDMWAW
jgi:hypothetical protein